MNPVLLPDAQWFDLEPETRAPMADGAPYRIFVALPRTPAPAGGFPVVYMLDANAGFASLVEVMRRGAVRPQATGIEEAVIVGIGYPDGDDHRARRSFDYTAGPSREAPGHGAPGPDGAQGGAQERRFGGRDGFLGFIENTLKPRIATLAAIDTARQTLFGHSLAGWFTLDVMTRDTDAFATYVAVSPSIWWDEARLIEGLGALTGRPVRLALMVGEWEQALAPWQESHPEAGEMSQRRARRAMVDRSRDFAARFVQTVVTNGDGVPGEVRFELLAGEDHASVLAPAMARALRFALARG
ncbi:alpha/beta hydrolase [Ancylobacter pratisalsi]|uniref:Alpha/beta hydrolase n=1 Tax=Ancylobacter pratisalsi TaxID=1745854 RepID=A0A6P1YN34_9HYPH|nr:alpha/beta hydrolase-fold protein [Ancylobacter pratisalsi]QIB34857.1 alpha/beta hydrolase [Ancylobacter pratisalsi]